MIDTLTTERLHLRPLLLEDAPFVLGLLNEPSFLRFIGDKGVRTVADAERYITTGPHVSYAEHGFGMWLVERRADGEPLGFCGLVKRPTLEDVDIGFAFRPAYWSQGYAFESSQAVIAFALQKLRLRRVVAITDVENVSSARLLERLGLRYERMVTVKEGEAPIRLFSRSLDPDGAAECH